MLTPSKAGLVLTAAVAGATLVCPLCGGGPRTAEARDLGQAVQVPDTATVRLHVSKMTCETCPTTARLALKRLSGVYNATVTLADSLGVVQYDPARVTATQIAAHLTQMTGFGATILSTDRDHAHQ